MMENKWLILLLALFIANMFMSLWLVFTYGKSINKVKAVLIIWLLPVLGLLYSFRSYYLKEKKLPNNPDYNTEGVSAKSGRDVWWP